MSRAGIFAEDYFQVAFDRGRDHAMHLFVALRVETARLPPDCPLSPSDAEAHTRDVLPVRRATPHVLGLMRAMFVIGAKLEWRKLTQGKVRTKVMVSLSPLRRRRWTAQLN